MSNPQVELAKKELEKILNRQTNNYQKVETNWWRPTTPLAKIRILPAIRPETDLFYRTSGSHWGLDPNSKMPISCPYLFDKSACPICDYGRELSKTLDPEAPETQELLKRLRPNKRYLANIVDLNNVAKGVQVYGFPESVRKNLLAYMADAADWGDFTDPKTGFNVKITTMVTNGITGYKVDLERNPSPLANPEWLNQRYDLDKVVFMKKPEELLAVLETAKATIVAGVLPAASRQQALPMNTPAVLSTATGPVTVVAPTSVAAKAVTAAPTTTATAVEPSADADLDDYLNS